MLTMRSASLVACFVAALAACSNAANPGDASTGDTVGQDTRGTDARRAGCRTATTCSACVAMNMQTIDCGWSIAGNGCIDADPMNVLQSADGSSTGRDWAPLAGLCPGSTLCQGRTDCVSCDTSGGGCGWCANGNRCLPGLGATSQDGSCGGADWLTYGSYCPNANAYCAMHASSCSDCTNTPICGMCSGTTECRPGTQQGPLNGMNQEMCATYWAWLPSNCSMYDAGTPVDSGSPDSGTPDAATTDVTADATSDVAAMDASALDAGTVE